MFFVYKYQPSRVNGFFTINRYVKLDPFKKVPKIEEFLDECKMLAERRNRSLLFSSKMKRVRHLCLEL